jgi:putative sterol carrier protein
VFQFDVKDGSVVQLRLQPNSTTFVSFGDAGNAASVTIKLDASTFGKIFSGKLSSQEAYMKGLVSISGSMVDAMKLDSVVAALAK